MAQQHRLMNHDVRKIRVDDCRNRTRTVPMEVLSLGYSRTGTMTMQAALEILGYPTWHHTVMAQSEQDMAMWVEALEMKYERGEWLDRSHFDRLLGAWGACTDQPACVFAEELIEAYPEAKVILVECDVEKWYASFNSVIIKGSRILVIPLIEMLNNTFVGAMGRLNDFMARYVFDVQEPRVIWGIFNNPAHFSALEANARGGYLRHNQRVKKCTKSEQVLTFRFENGWEPLCKFLGKDIPDTPFPRVNETKVTQDMIVR